MTDPTLRGFKKYSGPALPFPVQTGMKEPPLSPNDAPEHHQPPSNPTAPVTSSFARMDENVSSLPKVEKRKLNEISLDEIVNDTKVRAEMEKAFAESGDGLSHNSSHEQGGWIVKTQGGYEVIRWPQGESGSIEIPRNVPHHVIGRFHTHPGTRYGNIDTFYHGPSNNDLLNSNYLGIPSFVIDRRGIFRVDPGAPNGMKELISR